MIRKHHYSFPNPDELRAAFQKQAGFEHLFKMTNERAMNKCVIYARSATDDGLGNHVLVPQLELCRRYATTNGYEVVAEFVDIAGGHTLERRGLQQLLSYIHENPVTVVTQDSDRLSRCHADFLELLETFSGASIPLRVVY